jgi:two-component system CheB/CheR fusion protein
LKRPAAPAADGLTIVGVGASAGGLDAFRELLGALPAEPGLALVLVQHMAPNHDSALPVLLASRTPMRVVQATDGVRIQPDNVYVIPPNVQMAIEDGTLALSPRPTDRTQYTPIDTFFASLAAVKNSRAIAVVLSGTASDGAIGLREVKASGGITFAQDPGSARFDSMPRAAIATGMVDLILKPAEIAAKIMEIASHPYVRAPLGAPDRVTIGEDQLARIFDLLRPVSGVEFRHYKLATIRRRLARRMALHRITDGERYVALLQSSPEEVRGLFQDLLIHVTRFFREPESFEALAATVLPALIEGRETDHPIRVWVCGCATGEEAYSVAIALVEALQTHKSDVRAQILATDVSETAIEHARMGVYSASIAADVGTERLRRFFVRSDGNYRVNKTIRDLCVFARQDLTKDPPFSRLDLVMCRNVLIYMDSMLQRKLIGLFHYALQPDGFLVLGQAETVGAQASLFSVVDKKFRIHRKKAAQGLRPVVAFPYKPPAAPAERATSDRGTAPERGAAEHGLPGEVARLMLDRYAPPAVVVDADLQIVQFRGRTGPFLEPAPGDPSLSLLKMTREGLLYGLRTALQMARKKKDTVRKDGLQVRSNGGWLPVSIEVVPLTAPGRQHFLVVFDARPPQPAAEPLEKRRGRQRKLRPRDDDSLAVMQRELASSREYLQSIIQELEAANEELQSANEEILSSNEELQSTNEELDTAKEELQSTNEELDTLNDELHARNDELSRVNSDLINFVSSMPMAVVILGRDLRIRRFTPMAEKVLNLIPADVDRSISQIKPNIDCPDLEQLILEAMESMAPIERDVSDRDGRWYLLRIRPYKTLDNKIDGAVIALFDVDSLRRSERHVELARALGEALLQTGVQPVAVLDADLRVRSVNPAFAALFSLSPEEIRGRELADIGGPSWKLETWAATKLSTAVLPAVTIPPDPSARWSQPLRLSGHVVPSAEGPERSAVLLSVVDGRSGRERP